MSSENVCFIFHLFSINFTIQVQYTGMLIFITYLTLFKMENSQ